MSASLAACALALAAAAAHAAPAEAIRVEVAGGGKDVVRLVDARTQAAIAVDRLPDEPVGESAVSPDGGVVAVRHGAADGGDGVALYAIDRVVDPASGRRVGRVAQVLDYRPRDGRLAVSFRPVPNGSVVQVDSGRHPPFWRKVFFYQRDERTWYEWPRALLPNDPTEGVPRLVRRAASDAPYAAWLRPLEARAE